MKGAIDFVYPYVHGEDRFEELRYSLRSLEKHYTDPFRVLIVGDLPDWCRNVIHLPVERKQPPEINYENITYDAIWKMIQICSSDVVSGVFIRMYDDVYLLKDMGFTEISELRALYDSNGYNRNFGDGSASGSWISQLWRTMDALMDKGHAVWNYETHLPEVFLKSVMNWILTDFNALERRLLLTSLYCNVCWQPGDAPPKLVNIETNIKAGFYGVDSQYSYGASDYPAVKKIVKGKQFLNHNDEGLSQGLEIVIKHLFPNKSKYEK